MNTLRRLSLLAIWATVAACGGGGASTGETPPAAAPAPAPSPSPATGTTYHVRVDGGDASQCTGLADAAYPGSGSAQACAWSGPMIALPPSGTARIAGGDTLLIHTGEYRVGLGAPGTASCNSAWPWDCAMAAVPSGPDAAHPTRVLGQGHDAACPAPPQLWGTERVRQVLSLAGSSHVQLACLEITDRAPCVEFHSSSAFACNRDSYPYGDWASNGLYAADSADVQLSHLNIHGLAVHGVLAGRLSDWTVGNVRLAGNGWAGWDGDLGGDSSNSGTLRFSRWLVEWNGCAETWPGNQPTGCWAQEAGGYGDGVGTGDTGGDWLIEDSIFRFNTSDGLDLLYHKLGGSVTLNRVWAEGNAGNQVKVAGNSSITNSVVVGSCGSFSGKAYTFNVDNCRAVGDALVVPMLTATDVATLANNTIVSQGNVAVLTGGPAGAVLRLRNNILVGQPYFFSPEQQSADTYDNDGTVLIDEAYSLKQGLRNAGCSSPGTLCGNAGLVSASLSSADPHLAAGSAARDSGQAVGGVVPATDFYGTPRPSGAGVDRGAVEMP
ncbi:MAG TPA: choice-of-anchor Q domain-containing protein [Ideonella sp.]|nr:choice-of-anchor Q domain-containing protein [Ideonella sp.]